MGWRERPAPRCQLSVVVATLKSQMVKQSAGTIMLTWSAVRGHTYQVEFKTNFTSSPWMNVTNVVSNPNRPNLRLGFRP